MAKISDKTDYYFELTCWITVYLSGNTIIKKILRYYFN